MFFSVANGSTIICCLEKLIPASIPQPGIEADKLLVILPFESILKLPPMDPYPIEIVPKLSAFILPELYPAKTETPVLAPTAKPPDKNNPDFVESSKSNRKPIEA